MMRHLYTRSIIAIQTLQQLEEVINNVAIDINSQIYQPVRYFQLWLRQKEGIRSNVRNAPSPPCTLSVLLIAETGLPVSLLPANCPSLIPDSWLTHTGQLIKQGLLPDSADGRQFSHLKTTAAQLAAKTSVEINRPSLSSSMPAKVLMFIENFKTYITHKGMYGLLDCIDTNGRNGISVDFLGDGIVIDWEHDDEEKLIRRILTKYCDDSPGRNITLRTICDGIAMAKSDVFDLELMLAYMGRFFARLKLYAGVLPTFGMEDQICSLLDGMSPPHYVTLLRKNIRHLTAWGDVWNRISALNIVFENGVTVDSAKNDDQSDDSAWSADNPDSVCSSVCSHDSYDSHCSSIYSEEPYDSVSDSENNNPDDDCWEDITEEAEDDHCDAMSAVKEDWDDEPCPPLHKPTTNSNSSMPEWDDQSSNCPNCPESTDGHTLDECLMECLNPALLP